MDFQQRFTTIHPSCRSVISSKVQYDSLCVQRSWRLMTAVLLWITVIIPDSNSGATLATFVIHGRAPSSYSIWAFQQDAHKRNAILFFSSMNIIPEVWNEILMLNESHILWLPNDISAALLVQLHTHTRRERGQVFFFFLWVILATDSGPVIVSGAAGSEASLSYWPASISHWAKTQGWWHCRWEHVNFAL